MLARLPRRVRSMVAEVDETEIVWEQRCQGSRERMPRGKLLAWDLSLGPQKWQAEGTVTEIHAQVPLALRSIPGIGTFHECLTRLPLRKSPRAYVCRRARQIGTAGRVFVAFDFSPSRGAIMAPLWEFHGYEARVPPSHRPITGISITRLDR